MRRSGTMGVAVRVSMVVAVGMEVSHPRMLYYNITGVYDGHRKKVSTMPSKGKKHPRSGPPSANLLVKQLAQV
jgi:hypothetical protein